MAEDVLGLTAQIVSAHVTKNSVSVEELPGLIREVYKTLANVGEVAAPVEAAKPAVAVTKSVFPDYIVCLEDGKQMTMLKRHLMTEHNMTVDQYRAKWGLPSSYPMVAPNYAVARSQLACSKIDFELAEARAQELSTWLMMFADRQCRVSVRCRRILGCRRGMGVGRQPVRRPRWRCLRLGLACQRLCLCPRCLWATSRVDVSGR